MASRKCHMEMVFLLENKITQFLCHSYHFITVIYESMLLKLSTCMNKHVPFQSFSIRQNFGTQFTNSPGGSWFTFPSTFASYCRCSHCDIYFIVLRHFSSYFHTQICKMSGYNENYFKKFQK